MNPIHWMSKVFLNMGASWVLWLLIALSIVSIAVILERALIIWQQAGKRLTLSEEAREAVEQGNAAKAIRLVGRTQGLESRIVIAGLNAYDKGPDSIAEAFLSARAAERTNLEAYLGILGTLGNNAPFVGLLGTVIGIIKAFHDLSRSAGGGPKVVMAGISEALVATAMGLFVAIPAVMAFNYFQRRIRFLLAGTEELTHWILSEARKTAPSPTAPQPATKEAPVAAAAEKKAPPEGGTAA